MCTVCPLEFERDALCVVTFLTRSDSGTIQITCVYVVALLVKEWGVYTQVER